MNNSYTFPFITGIIYLFNMVLTNRDEVIQQYFKSGLSYNEIMSALSAYPNAYQYVRQFKRIFYHKECQKAQLSMFLRLR